jgi:hypothetical protein
VSCSLIAPFKRLAIFVRYLPIESTLLFLLYDSQHD